MNRRSTMCLALILVLAVLAGALGALAACADPEFTVSYNAGGGSLVDSQTVAEGDTATKPQDPVREGYVFTGWYTDSGCTELFDFSTPITKNITLYAGWREAEEEDDGGEEIDPNDPNNPTGPTEPEAGNVYVQFDSNGGVPLFASSQVKEGSSISAPSTPERAGYSFGGWYSDIGFAKKVNFPYTVTKNTTFYAKWIAEDNTVTVTFRPGELRNYDEWDVEWEQKQYSINLERGEKLSQDMIPSEVPKYVTAHNDSGETIQMMLSFWNFRYEGAAVDSGGVAASLNMVLFPVYTNDGDKTIYAMYIPVEEEGEEASLIVHPGTGEDVTTIYAYKGDKIGTELLGGQGREPFYSGINVSPIRQGYKEDGYFKTEQFESGAQYEIPFELTETENHVYVRWTEAADVTVTYKYSARGEVYLTQSAKYNGFITRPENPFLDGYIFDGWYWWSVNLSEGSFDFENTRVRGNVITLVAKWVKPEGKRITFDSDGGSPVPSIILSEGTIPGELPISSRNGYSFTGWYTSSGALYDASAPLTENITLTAEWEKINTPIEWFEFTEAVGGYQVRLADDVVPDDVTILDIPETYNGKNITMIAGEGFMDLKNLTEVYIPKNVDAIDYRAFKDCVNLTTVHFPADTDISRIGFEAFKGCSELKQLEVEGGASILKKIVSISNDSFAESGMTAQFEEEGGLYYWGDILMGTEQTIADDYSASELTEINIRQNTRVIAGWALRNCTKVASIYLPDSVVYLSHEPFPKSSALETISFPAGIIELDEYNGLLPGTIKEIEVRGEGVRYKEIGGCLVDAQDSVLLASEQSAVVLPEGIKVIGVRAFTNKEAETIVIPSSYTTIRDGAFNNSTISYLNIPDNVGILAEEICAGCTNLESVTFGAKSPAVKAMFFSSMQSTVLNQISVSEENENMYDYNNVLYDKKTNTVIYVPDGITGEITFVEQTTAIAADAFSGEYANITSIIFPDGITVYPARLPKVSERIHLGAGADVVPCEGAEWGEVFAEAMGEAGENGVLQITVSESNPYIYADGKGNIVRRADGMALYFSKPGDGFLYITDGIAGVADENGAKQSMRDAVGHLTGIYIGAAFAQAEMLLYEIWSFESADLTVSEENPYYYTDEYNNVIRKDDHMAIYFCVRPEDEESNIFYISDTIAGIADDTGATWSLQYALMSSNVNALYIGAAFNDIEDNRIYFDTLNILSITVSDENPYYDSRDNIVYTEGFKQFVLIPLTLNVTELVLPAGLEEIPDNAFGLTESSLDGNSVGAFWGGDIQWGFWGTISLGKVSVEEGSALKRIGKYAFYGTYNTMGSNASLSVTEIDLSNAAQLEIIDDYAFARQEAQKAVLPGVRVIGENAFYQSALTEVIMAEGVEEIRALAFAGDRWLTKLDLPESVLTIGNMAFYDTGLITEDGYITYDENGENGRLILMPEYTASEEGISYVVPEDVTCIWAAVMNASEGSGLRQVYIHGGVTEIKANAFNVFIEGLTIYVEAAERPEGWDENWNSGGNVVAWDCLSNASDDGHGNIVYIDEAGLRYSLNAEEKTAAVLAQFVDMAGSITVPASVNFNNEEYAVTAVNAGAFLNMEGLTSVTLPEGLLKIGVNAFAGTSLTQVTIPSTVKEVGARAFEGTLLTSAVIASGATYGEYVFANISSLATLTIEEGAEEIPAYAFYSAEALNAVTLPSSMKVIGDRAFSMSGVAQLTIPENSALEYIGESAFNNCKLQTLDIPVPVEFGGDAFRLNKQLTQVTMAVEGVIPEGQFNGCTKLTTVTLTGDKPTVLTEGEFTKNNIFIAYSKWCATKHLILNPGVTEIPAYAFYGSSNNNLGKITLTGNITKIGDYAFCNFEGEIAGDLSGVKQVGEYAFAVEKTYEGEARQSLNIGSAEHDLVLGANAFALAPVTALTLTARSITFGQNSLAGKIENITINAEQGFTLYDKNVFSGGSTSGLVLKQLHINANNIDILQNTFSTYFNELQTVVIEGDNVSIGEYAFYNCAALNSVTIQGDNVSIGETAFYENSGLKTLVLNGSGITVGKKAFSECIALTDVTLSGSDIVIGELAFQSCAALTEIELTCVTEIGEYAFNNCTSLNSVTMQGDNISIGEYAFYKCTSLNSVTIEGDNISIGETAFYANSGLKTLVLNGSGITIGKWAFCDCTALTDVTLSGSDMVIGVRAFQGCAALPEIELTCVTEIGEYAFYKCASLNSVTIQGDNVSIGETAFYANSGLKTLVLNGNGITIGKWAFSGCTALTNVTLSGSDIVIGELAFQSCAALTEIDLSCVTEIGRKAFALAGVTQINIPENVLTMGSAVFNESTVTVTVYFEEGALPEGWAADWADDMNEGSLIIYAQPEEGEGGGNTEGTGTQEGQE